MTEEVSKELVGKGKLLKVGIDRGDTEKISEVVIDRGDIKKVPKEGNDRGDMERMHEVVIDSGDMVYNYGEIMWACDYESDQSNSVGSLESFVQDSNDSND